jgi:hypothetical protein
VEARDEKIAPPQRLWAALNLEISQQINWVCDMKHGILGWGN